MVVVDTSSWIEMLRESGRDEVRERVIGHLRNGEARLVPMVRLELWNGARGAYEKKALREIERTVPELEMNAAVWNQAFDFARRARAAGLTRRQQISSSPHAPGTMAPKSRPPTAIFQSWQAYKASCALRRCTTAIVPAAHV